MACPNRKAPGLSSLILLVALVMAAAKPGSALKLEPTGTSSHFPPLLDCAPAPAALSNSKNVTAFRANVMSLLAALPSAAASAPMGFAAAATRSGCARRDRAFARGGAPRGGPSPGDCISCLSAAAQDVASGCDTATRRAGVWRAGCFLSYADTNASTAREDAFRCWLYDDDDDDGPTAALGSQCTANRTAAECSRCLNESARVVPALAETGRLSMVHGDAVVVVGYSCYLRVPSFPPAPRWKQILFVFVDAFDVIAVVLIELGGVLFCISKAREFNPA